MPTSLQTLYGAIGLGTHGSVRFLASAIGLGPHGGPRSLYGAIGLRPHSSVPFLNSAVGLAPHGSLRYRYLNDTIGPGPQGSLRYRYGWIGLKAHFLESAIGVGPHRSVRFLNDTIGHRIHGSVWFLDSAAGLGTHDSPRFPKDTIGLGPNGRLGSPRASGPVSLTKRPSGAVPSAARGSVSSRRCPRSRALALRSSARSSASRTCRSSSFVFSLARANRTLIGTASLCDPSSPPSLGLPLLRKLHFAMQLSTRVSAGYERESDHIPGSAVEPTEVVDAAELASPRGVDRHKQSPFCETRLSPLQASGVAKPAGHRRRSPHATSASRLSSLSATGVLVAVPRCARLLVVSTGPGLLPMDTATLRASTGLVVFLAHVVFEVADDVHDPVGCASNDSRVSWGAALAGGWLLSGGFRDAQDSVASPITTAARATTHSRLEGFVYFPRGEICFHFRELAAACRQKENVRHRAPPKDASGDRAENSPSSFG
ncbi:hypothetical protein ISCGN_031731 [Ixodes scapularis]